VYWLHYGIAQNNGRFLQVLDCRQSFQAALVGDLHHYWAFFLIEWEKRRPPKGPL
jgi:hypothetical protein